LAKRKSKTPARAGSGANVGYEAELWEMADALRGSMDAAEYKHVALGLIFLKYISDAFEERHARLDADRASGADAEDPDEYRALSIFWVPPEARWAYLKAQAKQATIGQLVATPWPASSATTRRSKACCRRTTPVPPSTRCASAG
jgi:type I restriction enzyme M protein